MGARMAVTEGQVSGMEVFMLPLKVRDLYCQFGTPLGFVERKRFNWDDGMRICFTQFLWWIAAFVCMWTVGGIIL